MDTILWGCSQERQKWTEAMFSLSPNFGPCISSNLPQDPSVMTSTSGLHVQTLSQGKLFFPKVFKFLKRCIYLFLLWDLCGAHVFHSNRGQLRGIGSSSGRGACVVSVPISLVWPSSCSVRNFVMATSKVTTRVVIQMEAV